MEQKRVLISISNQNVHWNDHLLVLQKVSSEVNDLSSCFMSIATGKIGKVLFYFAFKSPETVLTDANAGYNSNRISYFCN